MVDLITEAAALQAFLDKRKWRFCFIGGLAVQHWGEPRLTRDLDLSLLTGFGSEAAFVDELLGEYCPRISDARQFALTRRVLLIQTTHGLGIDVSLAALPFEESAVARSVSIEMLPGVSLRLCSAEDLIVMKMFAGRDTDRRDVRSIIIRQDAASLDWAYIEFHIAELADLKDDDTLVPSLRRLRDSCRK